MFTMSLLIFFSFSRKLIFQFSIIELFEFVSIFAFFGFWLTKSQDDSNFFYSKAKSYKMFHGGTSTFRDIYEKHLLLETLTPAHIFLKNFRVKDRVKIYHLYIFLISQIKYLVFTQILPHKSKAKYYA